MSSGVFRARAPLGVAARSGRPAGPGTATAAAGPTTASTALAVDSQGDVVVTGLVDAAAEFDRGPMAGYGMADAFLMKLSSDGEPLWSERFGSNAPGSILASVRI